MIMNRNKLSILTPFCGRGMTVMGGWREREHEVKHTGHELRAVLIMDIWHPELPADKRVAH